MTAGHPATGATDPPPRPGAPTRIPSARVHRRIRALWPQGPVSLFMLFVGMLNLLAGLRARDLLDAVLRFGGVASGELNEQGSLGALGSGAQLVLGAWLILVGLGLLWRYRIAWTFALLLLLITIAVNLAQGLHASRVVLPGLVLIALVAIRGEFTRRTLLASTVVSLVSIITVLAYGTFGSFLLGREFEPKIDDLVTGLYYTIVTLSTIGYGDIHPVTLTTKLFVISLVVVGLSVFATAIVSLLGPALSSHLNRFFVPSGAKMPSKDHVILVGKGAIARNTARELQRRQIPLVQVVATDSEPPLPDQPVVHGDASDDAVLQKANIGTARMVIAAEDDDGENAFISLAAKDLNPDVRVLAVASSPRSIRRLKLARADLVFAPAAVGSRLLADLVEGQEIPAAFLDLVTTGAT